MDERALLAIRKCSEYSTVTAKCLNFDRHSNSMHLDMGFNMTVDVMEGI